MLKRLRGNWCYKSSVAREGKFLIVGPKLTGTERLAISLEATGTLIIRWMLH